jgi:hypothetical protein
MTGGGFEGLLMEICTDFSSGFVSDVEVFIPYPPGIGLPPIGDAVLAPGYAPMREAVAALAPQLRQAGVQINTARTVILSEENVSLPSGEGGLVETTVLAPIGPIGRDFAGTQELQSVLAERGMVIGALILETNVPESPLPAGNYLVIAYREDDDGEVSFVDVNGETLWQTPLFSAPFEQNDVQIPVAAIYEGTKYCLSCSNDWCDCYPCSWWNVLWGLELAQCRALLNQ